MKISLRNLMVLVLFVSLTGCAGFQDFTHQRAIRRRANIAYAECVCPEQMRIVGSHFEHGWIAGFSDVANGSCGRKRPFAPSKYYTISYQTDSGQQMLADWQCGYEEGTQYGLDTDASRFHVIPNLSGASLPGNEPIVPDWYFASTQTAKIKQDPVPVDEFVAPNSDDSKDNEKDGDETAKEKKDSLNDKLDKRKSKNDSEQLPSPAKTKKGDELKDPAKESKIDASPSDIIEETDDTRKLEKKEQLEPRSFAPPKPEQPEKIQTSTSRRRDAVTHHNAVNTSNSFNERIRQLTDDVLPAGFVDSSPAASESARKNASTRPRKLKNLLSFSNSGLEKLFAKKKSEVVRNKVGEPADTLAAHATTNSVTPSQPVGVRFHFRKNADQKSMVVTDIAKDDSYRQAAEVTIENEPKSVELTDPQPEAIQMVITDRNEPKTAVEKTEKIDDQTLSSVRSSRRRKIATPDKQISKASFEE